MKKVYLIQGAFFQQGASFSVEEKPGVGPAVAVKESLNYFTYMGIVFEDPENNKFVGTMSDRFGYSDLTNITISNEEISYTKKYHNRPDTIMYSFKKVGDKFVGRYQGAAAGKGQSNCMVTETDASLFEPAE